MSYQIEGVTIAVLNYNGRNYLEETINSIKALDYPVKKLLMVDDGSTDGSTDFVRINHPDVKIVEMGSNTKMLNRVRNRAIFAADTDFVFITDNDITFAPDCLTILMERMRVLHHVAVLTPRVMYQDDQTRIYIDHNEFHYVCASIDDNRGKRLEEVADNREANPTFGCGIMLIDKSKIGRRGIGFFDEDYPMGWGDDGEFHHRVNLSGLRCYAIPSAVVYHKAVKGAPRIFGQLLNRWCIIIETYSAQAILVFLPALVLYECVLFVGVAMKGRGGEYLKALRTLIRTLPLLKHKRTKVFNYKTINEREIFTAGRIYAPPALVSSPFARFAWTTLNFVLNGYWRIARRFA
jgi:GT2 family glycosyltransferase